MDAMWPFIIGALILLACPLGCLVIGAGIWVVARVRGQEREFSAGCMSGSCNHAEHSERREVTPT